MGGLALTATATFLLVILVPPPQVALSAGPSPRVAQAAAGLSSKDAVARARAAAQLGEMGGEAAPAVPLLVKLLSDEAEVFAGIGIGHGDITFGRNSTVSDVAATALGRIGDKRAVGPLCALMLSKSQRVNWLARDSAAKALGEIGDGRAVPSLCLALSDSMIDNEAEESLVKIGAPAVKPLVNAASTGTPGLCQKAFAVLGKIGKPAVPSLVNLMKPGKGEVARLAAHALGNTGDLDALEALCAALKDPKAGSRPDAVSGLSAFCSHLSGEGKLKALVVALEGDAVDPVVALFKDKSRPVDTRKDAGDVLTRSRNPRAVEPLVEAMTDANDQIRYAGFHGICYLAIDISSSRPWFDAEDPAGKGKWDKARADLLEALKGKALRPLVKALGSKESQVQSGAQSALRNLTGQNLKTRAEWEAWLKEQEGK